MDCVSWRDARRADAKRDRVELPIVRALEAAGCRVLRTLHPDLIVQRGHLDPCTWLLEVKKPKDEQREGALTERQLLLLQKGWVFTIVHTPEEALRAVGVIP